MLTEVAGEIVLPKIMASMIDSGIGAEVAGLGTGYILSRALLMIACICIMIIGGIGGHFFAIRASVYFSADLRQGVFEKVQNFSFKNIDNFSTGSGKSSLVQLIPRLYDVTDGEVLVDGVNVKDYGLKNLRDGVGMVLQKNVLFSGSIEENLRWGDENATMEEIRAAADAAQADGFVNAFTDGYNMELGQGGVNVSGGQKQRLCIARALLKKPKILILDDSTSAVDTATEAKIRQAFTTSLKHSTKIIIAQRITSVIDADKIIVLEDGKIIGMGNHNELMKNCEEYRDIYYSQTDKEKEVS